MMQKEVADRMLSAEPNTKAYGSLSIAVQYYMTAKVAFIVPRTVFVLVQCRLLPSSMVRREEPQWPLSDEDFFFVSSIFLSTAAKTLWNNLISRFGKTFQPEVGIEVAGLQIICAREALLA